MKDYDRTTCPAGSSTIAAGSSCSADNTSAVPQQPQPHLMPQQPQLQAVGGAAHCAQHGDFKKQLVLAGMAFDEALQRFRGFMQRVQPCRSSARSVEHTGAAGYAIMGNAPEQKDQGIAALRTVRGNSRLDKLSAEVVECLCNLVHARLALFNYEQGSDYRGLVTGMSGGADSTLALVLACALRDRFGYEALAVHCIHRLDPDDDIWLTNNIRLCERLQVQMVTPVLDIVYGNGVSPEDSSRAERYRALLENTRRGVDCLVLGHQADDQVESFMLALKRGSGPHGLRGMRFLIHDERGVILRPLLDLHKIEVEQLLVSSGYEYVFDLSNNYLKFERNFMRLKVLPKLRERFVGIDRSILRSQAICAAEHDMAERFTAAMLPCYLQLRQGISNIPDSQGLVFNFERLDLSDRNLTMMLLRAFFARVIHRGVDFNVIERSMELMVKDHDRNGLIELHLPPTALLPVTATPGTADGSSTTGAVTGAATGSTISTGADGCGIISPLATASGDCLTDGLADEDETYAPGCGAAAADVSAEAALSGSLCVSTFLNLLCVYIKDRSQSLEQLTGQHVLRAGESLTAGAYSYSLVRAEGTALQCRDSCSRTDSYGGAVFTLQAGHHGNFEVVLDFDTPGSLRLKPVSRRHSRELKKLFIEHGIAPWQRACQPLVKDSSGAVLAVGNVFACSPAQCEPDSSSSENASTSPLQWRLEITRKL